MKNYIRHLLVLGLIVWITGCASKPEKMDVTENASGFLMNYDLLEPIPSPAGLQYYVYQNPEFDRGDFDAAIVEPVFIFEGATSAGEVNDQQIENARQGINAGLERIVGSRFQITDTPGPRVFRMQTAITGAMLETEGFKPWNIIPVSAAITLASHATGYENRKPVLVVELKFTDSESGELLKEILTTISGDNFRNASNTSSEFENLAYEWVKQAMEYSNKK